MKRVIVFVDEENVFRRARDVFGWREESVVFGRVDPMKFGQLFLDRCPSFSGEQRELVQVRVYTGRPSQVRDHEGYATHRRRVSSWEKAGCWVHARPLRYRKGYPPQQKGVDVKLALDVIRLKTLDKFDIAVVATVDTDMVPILETFWELANPKPQVAYLPVEVTAWKGKEKFSNRLNLGEGFPSDLVWCHFLTLDDYNLVADHKDYSQPAIDQIDWRITDQESYLQHAELMWKRYHARSQTSEHEHCVFCWAKFMDPSYSETHREYIAEHQDVLTEGYIATTISRQDAIQYWICKQCFDDFVEAFQWRVVKSAS